MVFRTNGQFLARFDGCNRIWASFRHGKEPETDTSMQKSNHPVKTLHFGMSSDSLSCFLEEQAARGPGLTKDWNPWRSMENPENRWTAMVTSPFIIPFWVIRRYIMLVLFKHSKHSWVAPRLKVWLSHSAPQSHGLPNKWAVIGEVWWLQHNFGIFSTRQGTGIWYFHAEVKSSSEDIKLRHVIGFSLMFLEEQAAHGPGLTKDWSPWRWKPWKPLNGLSNFAFYHPSLSSNILHHVGPVLQGLTAFSSCSKVEGLTSPLSAATPWSSEQTCKFSARFDGCNRIFGCFLTRQGTGIWYFHAEVKSSSKDIKLRHVIGFSLMIFSRTSCPRPWSDKGLKPLAQHWTPCKPLNGLSNFAIYHPFLSYNTLHHVGAVFKHSKHSWGWRSDFPTQRRNPMVFRTNVQVFGEVRWLQQNFGIFSTRKGAGIWYFDAKVKSSSENIKLQHVIGFSLMFLEEQAARGPGLTKDWSPWRSIENPENHWTALVTSPFIIHFWGITCYIMLVGSVQALKAFLNCSRVEGPTFPLSATIPWSSEQMGSNRPGLVAATEFGHLFDTAGNWNLILPCGSQIIQWRH